MTTNLYKIKVETELMVYADDINSATFIAKNNAPNEVAAYGKASPVIVTKLSEIPEDWKNIIPYTPQGIVETRKCQEIIPNAPSNQFVLREGLSEEEINNIVKIQETKKDSIEVSPVKESKPKQPKPSPNLDWQETQSGRPLPPLRFMR
jgi:hypothetical protein